jgi:hypothetical protein
VCFGGIIWGDPLYCARGELFLPGHTWVGGLRGQPLRGEVFA